MAYICSKILGGMHDNLPVAFLFVRGTSSTICCTLGPGVPPLCQTVRIRCKAFFPAELKTHKHMGYIVNGFIEMG